MSEEKWVADIRAREEDGCAVIGAYREDVRDLLAERDAALAEVERLRFISEQRKRSIQRVQKERDDAEAEVKRLRDWRNQKYDDDLSIANWLVGDMMAQRDTALAEAKRLQSAINDWQCDGDQGYCCCKPCLALQQFQK